MPEPILVRRQLGRELHRLRDKADKTDREVAAAKLVSRSKLWRIEHGKSVIKVADVRALCWFYEASRVETEALVELAIGSSEYSWWEQHGSALPEWFRLHVGLETVATAIRTWEPEVVPGLFQTNDYATTMIGRAHRDMNADEIKRRVQLRMRRQHALFGRPEPPHVTAVFGELVIRRPLDAPDVHAAQLRRLSELAELDHVDLRVMPWTAGAHAAMDGAFKIFDCDDTDDPAVAYTQAAVGAWYHEKQRDVMQYRTIFDQLYNESIPFEEYAS